MGSENEIERFYMYAGDGYTVEHEEHDEGEWVRWPDHVAARKADQERIAELESLAGKWERDAERLRALAYEAHDDGAGFVNGAAVAREEDVKQLRASLSGETD